MDLGTQISSPTDPSNYDARTTRAHTRKLKSPNERKQSPETKQKACLGYRLFDSPPFLSCQNSRGEQNNCKYSYGCNLITIGHGRIASGRLEAYARQYVMRYFLYSIVVGAPVFERVVKPLRRYEWLPVGGYGHRRPAVDPVVDVG